METHYRDDQNETNLCEAIGTECGRLAQIGSLLGCLVEAMKYDENVGTSADGAYCPDVAGIARLLLQQSIDRLDSILLNKHSAELGAEKTPC